MKLHKGVRTMKLKIKIISVFFLAVFMFTFVSIKLLKHTMEKSYEQLDGTPVAELADVKDGTYEGLAETELSKVTAVISVKENRIADIKLTRHVTGKGKKAERMLKEMLEKNTSEVDAVSGATLSSKTIRAAVRNALLCGTH